MPLYEYRCRDCDETFELRRPMAEATAPAACPDGHTNTVKLFPVFASVGGTAAASATASPAPSTGGGCGGHCACHG